jgi:hypothetical protein
MGNHDGEGRFDNKNMGQVFARGRYSLFTNGPDNIHGTGNYAVNIKNEDNQLLYSLIMLDSNRYRKYDTRDGYDYIYPEQIAWYEWIIKGAAKAAGVSSIPSLAFFHIPLPEINDIKAKMTLENQVEAESAFRETPCPPEINTGLFSRMKDIGSTKAIFFGHDHVNLLNYTYQGIHFVYGLKTGYCSYYDNDRIGTTLITINDDSTIDVQFKYYVSE